ncbi:MAG TPA: hypothetical protein VG826_11730 [Pirellulales bacterium]|nr:hypothetical protein [Pirellulales bacterium]
MQISDETRTKIARIEYLAGNAQSDEALDDCQRLRQELAEEFLPLVGTLLRAGLFTVKIRDNGRFMPKIVQSVSFDCCQAVVDDGRIMLSSGDAFAWELNDPDEIMPP